MNSPSSDATDDDRPVHPAGKSAENAEVLGKCYPLLGTALRYHDELDALPSTAWFRASKKSHKEQIGQIVDAVIRVLNTSGAEMCRREIRTLHKAIKTSLQRQAEYRERLISAPLKASLSFLESMRKTSRETYDKWLAAEMSRVTELREQIAELKGRFRAQLTHIGIEASDGEIDTLLSPVTRDDFVSMAGVIKNISSLTTQFEQLMHESKEGTNQTKRYYGMYFLLVYSIDRIHKRFINEIEGIHLPKLSEFEQEACKNIARAQNLIKRNGHDGALAANVNAGNETIEACRVMAGVLQDYRDTILRENQQVRKMLAAAANTYKTVKLSSNVAELMNDCQDAFRALRQLQLPPLRPFQNIRLKEEMQRLTERMIESR